MIDLSPEEIYKRNRNLKSIMWHPLGQAAIKRNCKINEYGESININQPLPVLQKQAPQAKEYVGCINCRKHGIRKKYLKTTMLPIERKTTRKGKAVVIIQYMCPRCTEKYKPRIK